MTGPVLERYSWRRILVGPWWVQAVVVFYAFAFSLAVLFVALVYMFAISPVRRRLR
jgi:hypothetical protein